MPSILKRNTKRKYTKRTKSHTDFYNGKPWKRLRTQYMREHVLCEDCLKLNKTTPSVICHHIHPRADYPELELSYGNLRALCNQCHSDEHKRLNREHSL